MMTKHDDGWLTVVLATGATAVGAARLALREAAAKAEGGGVSWSRFWV
jgi:hypothetical protein